MAGAAIGTNAATRGFACPAAIVMGFVGTTGEREG
ncbi:hypothetical protein EV655_106164 [Rhodovulum euryhalinum]|uniref:Uncharacterized protein n=1 Tax=Rhodovulum euryhalinum TaxID=35805 RepID=A0A4R2KDK6_9RHOB|nr:hypothetical protein EV655_106164 [Rhodovulum euryhalinum]